jgi:predicted DNA-binding transcriptional regulator AlpA
MKDNELETQAELASWLRKSEAWLERGRWDGSGPPYVKIGRSVRYRRSDVAAWLDAKKRTWTRQGD